MANKFIKVLTKEEVEANRSSAYNYIKLNKKDMAIEIKYKTVKHSEHGLIEIKYYLDEENN